MLGARAHPRDVLRIGAAQSKRQATVFSNPLSLAYDPDRDRLGYVVDGVANAGHSKTADAVPELVIERAENPRPMVIPRLPNGCSPRALA